MHEHGPDDLTGPVRGSAAWWQGLAAPPDTPPAETAPPKKKRKSATPIRKDLVERVRKEIAAGTYDTQEKWEAALDCLLGRLHTDG
jgi:hypothetical protein